MSQRYDRRRQWLPVGGIKEKILAAVATGMKQVIIPAKNMKDIQDIPKDLRGRLKIMPVERIDEVWPLACAKPEAKPEAKAKGKGGKAEAGA